MEQQLNDKIKDMIWVAKALFDRMLVTGSTGNISILHDGYMYITKSGSCFGRLNENSFAVVSLAGQIIKGTPSKEYPMHLSLYHADSSVQAVLHTHSLYCTALSCRSDPAACCRQLYAYTPYLKLLTKGRMKTIPYHAPGSRELFSAFEQRVETKTAVYLLQNHGIVSGAPSILKAFYIVEEFEASARLQQLLQQYAKTDVRQLPKDCQAEDKNK